MNYDAQRTGFEIVPCEAPLGAEIRGLDLRRQFSHDTIDAIEAAMFKHIVLVIRDQNLTEVDQLAFCRRFGELYKNPNGGEIRMVSNQREHLEPVSQLHDTEMSFHHDTIFRSIPQKSLCMYSVDIPSWGGNTIFANMELAYETLPADLKARISGLTAFHAFAYTKTKRIDVAELESRPNTSHASHPVAILHPHTGHKILYVNRLMTLRIDDVPEDESEALLTRLVDHAEQRQFQYEHVWRKGDVILWDNIASMHARTDMPKDQRRVIRHCSVLGKVAPLAA